jgi:hypothetical protein
MKILKSYSTGIIRASSQGKMILVLWAFSLLFASVVYFMGAGYFAGALGQSELAESLLQEFDAGLFLEMLVHNQAPVGMMFKIIVVLAFLYYWVSIFLTGGILHVLLSPSESVGNELRRPRFAPAFFQGAGRYFGRLFRLEVCSLILWAGFIVFQLVFNAAAKPLTSDGANEKMFYYMFWVRVGLSLILIFFIHMVLDYARIIIVRTEANRVMRALWDAWRFIFKRLFGTLALYYVLLITGGVVFLVYWGIHSRIPSGSSFTIWLAFLVGQIFIISRGWLKIAFQSAQLTFYGQN